jgi:uncharacterized protein YciI
MLFILRFTNKPEKASQLPQLYPAHLEWLKQQEARVLVAGAIKRDAEGPSIGGLWIVEADSKADAEELFRTDPFWVNEMRQSYEILYWSKAFPDKKVPV